MSPAASHGAYSRVPVVPVGPIMRDPRGDPVPPLNLRAAVAVAREQLAALQEEARASTDPSAYVVALQLGRATLADLLQQQAQTTATSATSRKD